MFEQREVDPHGTSDAATGPSTSASRRSQASPASDRADRAALETHARRLVEQAPPPPTTAEIVRRPLPSDAADPHAIRTDDDGAPWAAHLQQEPGLGLLAELLETEASSLGDLDLAATLVAWERVSAWVAARHAEALGALTARAGRFGGLDEVAAILATEAGLTQRAARDKLVWANTLGNFPAVADALERGRVDVPKARAICEEALSAPEQVAADVAALGLALAPDKTPPQLRRALRAAVIGLDPDAAKLRTEKARAERRVEFHALPDAMALISAYLPATDAVAVKTALDALARTTGSEDPRTFDQRRADYLGAIFHAICDAGEAPLDARSLTSAPTATGSTAHHGAARTSRPPRATSALGASHVPSESDASHLSSQSDSSHVSSQSGAPRESVGPRATRDASHPDASRDSSTMHSPAPDAETRAVPSVLWRRLATNQRQRPHLHVTVAASTLLGLDDAPGELTGYGPVPADVARLLATDATWRTLLTDRAGTVTAVGERTYRPGAVLTRHVAARDRTCTFVGCSRPAFQCDIDHRVPFSADRPAAEQTHPDNLHALCRFHHNLKTLHGWVPEHDPGTGATTWTSPIGTRRTRGPEPPLPPWESWLEELAEHRAVSPCPCAAPTQVARDALDRDEHDDERQDGPTRSRSPGGVRQTESSGDLPGADPPPPF